MSLMILILRNQRDFFVFKHHNFPKWLFKGSRLVHKKKILFSKSSSFELRLDLILYKRDTQTVFQRPNPNHPNNLGEQSKKKCDKIVWVHVRLSPFVCIKHVQTWCVSLFIFCASFHDNWFLTSQRKKAFLQEPRMADYDLLSCSPMATTSNEIKFNLSMEYAPNQRHWVSNSNSFE